MAENSLSAQIFEEFMKIVTPIENKCGCSMLVFKVL